MSNRTQIEGGRGRTGVKPARRRPGNRQNVMAAVIVAGTAALVAAIAVPGILRERSLRRMRSCQENLTKIDGAKEQWALESNRIPGALVETEFIVAAGKSGYLKAFPFCPSGFDYVINEVGTNPVCPSGLPGHSLSEVGDAITELESGSGGGGWSGGSGYSYTPGRGPAYPPSGATGSRSRQPNEPPLPAPPPRDMTFLEYGTSGFADTSADAVSTFAADVDTASYSILRNYLDRGVIPPEAAVRPEEVVNYFTDRYKPPADEVFAVYGEMAPSPFGPGLHLLRIGIKGREPSEADRKPRTLTFVIDCSGSMADGGRLELVRRMVKDMIASLRPEDRIGIAVYEGRGRELLEHVYAGDLRRIDAALDSLAPGGSTNVGEGLMVGYGMARRVFRSDSVNRVILCTDGVTNTGMTDIESIVGVSRGGSGGRIHLTAVGVGMGNYNDALLEQLADRANGHYEYIDDDGEARRFVGKYLGGGFDVIAQDVKIQLEFNPGLVRRYRLIGFENRALEDHEFRNDAVDAGEIGGGHSVTALYELELDSERRGFAGDPLVGTLRIRFKDPARGLASEEIDGRLTVGSILKTFDATDEHFKLAAMGAEYAELLKNSWFAADGSMKDLARVFDETFSPVPPEEEAADLRRLIGRAEHLMPFRPPPRAPVSPALESRRRRAHPDYDEAALIPMGRR